MLVATTTYTFAFSCEVHTPKEVYDEALKVLSTSCEDCSVADLWAGVVALFEDNNKLSTLLAWAKHLADFSQELASKVDISIACHNFFIIGRFLAFAEEGVGKWQFVGELAKLLVEQFFLAEDCNV